LNPNEKANTYTNEEKKDTYANEEKRKNILNIGKMRVNEENKYTLSLNMHLTSFSTTSTDISLRDSVVSTDASILYVSIKKQHLGMFTDTIHLSTATKQSFLEISGEVVK
jgi:hypothetical protein